MKIVLFGKNKDDEDIELSIDCESEVEIGALDTVLHKIGSSQFQKAELESSDSASSPSNEYKNKVNKKSPGFR